MVAVSQAPSLELLNPNSLLPITTIVGHYPTIEIIINHQGALKGIGFFYLINIPLPKSGFSACISSRITIGIHIVRYYQINNN
ncbi:hypothetical protein VTN77DRAFT_9657 [Rasamsonia byssochlamydoides]